MNFQDLQFLTTLSGIFQIGQIIIGFIIALLGALVYYSEKNKRLSNFQPLFNKKNLFKKTLIYLGLFVSILTISKYFVDKKIGSIESDRKMKTQEIISDLQSTIEGQSQQLSDSQQKQDSLLLQLKETQHVAEGAKKQSEETKAKIEPRQLTLQQEAELLAILKNIPNEIIDFDGVSGDQEATIFRDQLISIFRKAGWKIGNIGESIGLNPSGLLLIVQSKETAPSYTKLLQDTFKFLGFPAPAQIMAGYKPNSIKIFIGHKPITR